MWDLSPVRFGHQGFHILTLIWQSLSSVNHLRLNTIENIHVHGCMWEFACGTSQPCGTSNVISHHGSMHSILVMNVTMSTWNMILVQQKISMCYISCKRLNVGPLISPSILPEHLYAECVNQFIIGFQYNLARLCPSNMCLWWKVHSFSHYEDKWCNSPKVQ